MKTTHRRLATAKSESAGKMLDINHVAGEVITLDGAFI